MMQGAFINVPSLKRFRRSSISLHFSRGSGALADTLTDDSASHGPEDNQADEMEGAEISGEINCRKTGGSR